MFHLELFLKEQKISLTIYRNVIVTYRDTSDKFNQMVAARLRLVQQLGHLAGSLNITGLVWKKARLMLVQQLGHLAGSLNITGLVWKKLASCLCNSWDIWRAL
jgi:hypothetical protein